MYYDVSPHEIAKLKTRHGVRPEFRSLAYHNEAPRCMVLTRAGHQCLRKAAVTDRGTNYCGIYSSHRPNPNLPIAPPGHFYRPRSHHRDDLGADIDNELARIRRKNSWGEGGVEDPLLREEGEDDERSEWLRIFVGVAMVYLLCLTTKQTLPYFLEGLFVFLLLWCRSYSH
jgi:hypothetical protein